ncbi:MAG TPA: sigma-70 family RNA polymerase sigma factor [Polyangiaceae bacterium]|nr:sigma-70 family RNA polymerase sigma factor [Polyangiaceae bacterium]
MRDEAQARRLFEHSLELVEATAKQLGKLIGPSVELEELRSLGRLGLLEAAQRYDESRDVPFRVFAKYRVRGAIIDGLRRMATLPRRVHRRLLALQFANQVSGSSIQLMHGPDGKSAAEADQLVSRHLAAMAAAMADGLLAKTGQEDGEPVAVCSAANPEEAYERHELWDSVRRAISELPAVEATLLARHYLHGEHFEHVAADLGMSKSWASRLHARAVSRLSRRLRSAE